jgi:cytochrome P450
MAAIVNLFTGLGRWLLQLGIGLASLVRLIGIGIGCLIGGEGTVGSRLGKALAAPEALRMVFAVLRAFVPNIVLSKRFIASYDNAGTAIVTRYEDVLEVVGRDGDFAVVYQPRMEDITGGQNFFLGMQDTPTYTRDTSNMRIAVRRDDVSAVIAPFVARRAAELVAAAPGRIDVPKDLTLRVPAQLVGSYFGTPGPSEQQMIEWTTYAFWYLFVDLNKDPTVDSKTLKLAAEFRAYLDEAVRARKAKSTTADDVLNRCLAMQTAGLPGMDDLGIRNNLIGLIIGAIPTTSKAAVQALDQLLDRPDALAGAQQAARDGDDNALARYVFEALRFNPVNPLIYRRAVRDTAIAVGTLRARTIPKGTMVLAVNLSAMFDPLKIDRPDRFRVDRPWTNYILWGYGLHTCFGAHINAVMIPQILKPLLARQGLRRAAGAAGQVDTAGTPFPAHFVLEFDR